MRARSQTLELPALPEPSPLVLRRRGKAKRAAAWTARTALLVAACFTVFAVAHRLRAHQAGDTECCASVAAQKAR